MVYPQEAQHPEVKIRLRGVGKRYPNGVRALRDIQLDIYQGEIFGIIGRSGAGKSSLLRMLNLLESPSEGEIIISGEDISHFEHKRLRLLRQRVSMVFQHFNLMSSRTVAENVALPLRMMGVSHGERQRRVAELLQLVGLEARKDAYPAQLSGGQKQRVGIARALVLQPEILLCDEATSALDPESTQSILTLLDDINRRLGLTIVLITHEMGVIRDICDRVAVLDDGQVVESGEVWQVFGAPKHAVTHSLLGALEHVQKENGLRKRDGLTLDLFFNGSAGREPSPYAIASALGNDVVLLQGSVERIQGRSIGRLRFWTEADPSQWDAIVTRAKRVADEVEVRNAFDSLMYEKSDARITLDRIEVA
ncbi:methionine ABC transporter ATP-binding protein [Pseudomonas sp. NPDC087342]|uniref:methionine ABC transporter ATP-binding protein n=1 Tax=Pseudomonas sp. NPDC087342 TaxID=3364437 RepID=UPI00382FA717